MAMVLENSSAELLRALAHLSNKRGNYKDAAALKCAVELGIPDVIQKHGKPAMTLSELTAALPIKQSKAHCINRIMRVLVNAGFFVEQRSGDGKRDDEEESYALTPACRLLLKDEPLNARAHVLCTLDPAEMVALGSLSEWLQDDYPTAFETANGKNYWDYIAEKPARNKLFNEAMAVDSRLIATVLISQFKFVFEGLTSLVDVGGGTGTIARAIAETFPNLKCTVLDLQQVVADADLEGTENLEFVAGDMFEKIPNANAILLKMVLHDWSDEDCVRILKNCKRVIPEKEKGGKIILIELVLGGQNKDHVTVEAEICADIEMLASSWGKERTEKEWAKLFQDAGLGGGTGTIARAIAETLPNLKCTVLDLQQVVAHAYLEGTENSKFVAGDILRRYHLLMQSYSRCSMFFLNPSCSSLCFLNSGQGSSAFPIWSY